MLEYRGNRMKLINADWLAEQFRQESVNAIKKAMEHKQNGENYKWFYYDGMSDAYEKAIYILKEICRDETSRYW